MIPSDDGTICFEKYLSEQDISKDENHWVSRSGEIKIKPADLQEHCIHMIVDPGKGKMRWYIYTTQKRLFSPEEKKYILELFKYMEAQIKNVA